MNIEELKGLISVGNIPITVHSQIVYTGIYRFVRIANEKKLFLDFEDDYYSSGGLRVRFLYDSLESMVLAIEKYIDQKIDKWEYIKEMNCKSVHADWYSLRKDLYNGTIVLLDGYEKMNVGDMYWNGLLLHEISPDSSMDEIKDWMKKKR